MKRLAARVRSEYSHPGNASHVHWQGVTHLVLVAWIINIPEGVGVVLVCLDYPNASNIVLPLEQAPLTEALVDCMACLARGVS